MINDDILIDLKKWCQENNIIHQCNSNFWTCYETYKTEQLREFSEAFKNENRKLVTIVLDKVKFCWNQKMDYGRPTIEIDFDILLKNQYVGWYRELYFTNGEFVDNYFVIENVIE